MSSSVLTPLGNRAAKRLLCCLGVSLVFHAGLYALKPSEQWGLASTGPINVPSGLQVILVPQQSHTEGSSVLPDATATSVVDPSASSVSPVPALRNEPRPPPSANGLFVGPWYYAAQYLHRRPSPLAPIRPEYPALSDEEVHVVRILLMINTSGTVDSYRVVAGERGTPFSVAVVQAFSSARYAPGLIANMPVKSQLLAEVVFNPGSGVTQTSLSSPQGENLLR